MDALWLDPYGGLAGDMLLGGLVDLGFDPGELDRLPRALGLPEAPLLDDTVERRHMRARWVRYDLPTEHEHRHLGEILERIAGARLPPDAARGASDAFRRLAEAEARVHGTDPEEVHFHEVGAADAILEITGVALGLHRLHVDRILCGPLPTGQGPIRCAHGEIPCPAPAVLELLPGYTWRVDPGQGEMVTPTGAAILAAYGRPLPTGLPLTATASGYGAGTRSASVLRLTRLLDSADPVRRDRIAVLEAHLDDALGEDLGFLSERLLEQGALDVALSPLTMKKGRPGLALTCLAPPDRADLLARLILAESPTLGLRESWVDRHLLPRREREVQTRFGPIRLKWAEGRPLPKPEFEDCARAARSHGIPLQEVRAEALAASVESCPDPHDD